MIKPSDLESDLALGALVEAFRKVNTETLGTSLDLDARMVTLVVLDDIKIHLGRIADALERMSPRQD